MSILSLILHIEELNVPEPNEAAGVAQSMLQTLKPDGQQFYIQDAVPNPLPGQPWDLSDVYNLYHPSISVEENYKQYANILLSYAKAEKSSGGCSCGVSSDSSTWKQKRSNSS